MPWGINSAASAVSALPLKRWCSSYSGSATWSMTSALLPRRTSRSLWRWFTSKTCCSMSKCLRAGAVRAWELLPGVPVGCASARELFHLLLALSTSCFPMYNTKVKLSLQGPLKFVYKGWDVTVQGGEMGWSWICQSPWCSGRYTLSVCHFQRHLTMVFFCFLSSKGSFWPQYPVRGDS